MRVLLGLVAVTLVAVPLAAASRTGPEPYPRPHPAPRRGPGPPRRPPGSRGGEAPRASGIARRRGEPVYCGGGHANVVALTFDDGPGPYTEQLVSLLRAAGAHATFFLVGNRMQYWPSAARLEALSGNAV